MKNTIEDYLDKKGIKPLKKYGSYFMYLSPLHQDGKEPSFKVCLKKNLFYDYKLSIGGTLSKLKELIDNGFIKYENVKTIVNPSSLKNQIWKVENITNKQLIKYINNRSITTEVLNKYCYEVSYGYYENHPRTAIGFMNDKGGFELRSSQFKGCINHKSITTIFNQSDSTRVFEGFMDFLSFKTLSPENNDNYIVLNSTNQVSKVLDFINQSKNIYCYLDNDEAGSSATKYLMNNSIPQVTDMRNFYKEYSDLNDYLMNLR